MGGCSSMPEADDGTGGKGGGETATTPFESVPPILKDRNALGGGSEDSSRVGSLTMTRLRSTTRAALHLEFLTEVHSLQQQLAVVNDYPLLGLQEAAELLASQLGADLVAIWVLAKEDRTCLVLMATHGKGASVLERTIVLHVPEGTVQLGAACELSVPDAAAEDAAVSIEPAELWQGAPQLRSFVQVPIGTAAAPLGVLLLAKQESGSFDSHWWQVRLQLASTGLLPHVRHAQIDWMAQLLKAMDEVEDPVALIAVLLRSASRHMLKACNLRASARLALLFKDQRAGKALLFEAPSDGSAPPPGSSSHDNRLALPSDVTADVVASRMELPNTLLDSAVGAQQARFVADIGKYMSACGAPARDIFTRSSRLVSSIVVVPLIAGEEPPLGGLYFALDAPCEFVNIQDTLLGFIHGVTPMLYAKLRDQVEDLAAMVNKTQKSGSVSVSFSTDLPQAQSAKLPRPQLPGLPDHASRSSLSTSSTAAPEEEPVQPTKSGRLPRITSGVKVNTEAMLQVLQQDIRAKGRHSSQSAPELTVRECLGRGGFGIVYRGWWHKVPVAAKVMPARNNEREAMQDAVEMAVLSSVQHPNIVTVYSCLTDMVETADASASASASISASGELRTKYRRLRPDEDPEGEVPTYNIVVMEFCDKGTLRDAVKARVFHQALPNGAIGVRLAAAVEVLLDVAYALQYLHSMQLVHGDLRAENVLLKTDRARPLGATPKLADFGLTRILNDAQQLSGAAPARAAAHIAPEALTAGGQVTTAVDSYAFGILMWEAYTSKRAFSSVPPLELADRVTRGGLRPKFPSSAPPAFVSLAQACWAAEPAARPSFGEVAAALEEVAAQLARGSA